MSLSEKRRKLLIVDDTPDQLTSLQFVLEKEGFEVVAAATAGEALRLATAAPPDLIVSDVSMPGMGGLALCRSLREDPRTALIPVILLSAISKSEADQIAGMEQGADDYLPKRASPRLLLAKVRAVLRRFSAPDELDEILRSEGLVLDVQARTATVEGRRIALTRKEFDLLTACLRKRGRVMSVPYLLEAVWGYDPADYNDPRTVETHVSSLRRKLGPKFAKKLVNVWGAGYRFDA